MKVGKIYSNKNNKLMKKYIFVVIVFSLYIVHLNSQSQNSNWLFGFNDTLYKENCGINIWYEDSNEISFEFVKTPLNFESTMAAISDTSGNLLLYTNGCDIADASHDIIKNGGGLNPGYFYEQVCGKTGYIVPNGAMFIPYPNIDNRYILLHLGAEHDNTSSIKNTTFYYSVIEHVNGKFEVLEKNQILLNEDIESFAVVRHGNGTDWWIFLPEYQTNRYFRFLLNQNGIEEKESQYIGWELPNNLCKLAGLSAFSPDGNKYLRYNRSCGYQLFDFNRCSGLLSNFIYESVGYIVDDLSSDFVFSPDSKYIFINKLDHRRFNSKSYINKMYRVAIDEIGTKAKPFSEYELPYSLHFNRFYNSFNGKIYVLNSNSSEYIVEIVTLDGTDALEFTQYKLHVSNARTVPYFANFNLHEIDCDQVNTNNHITESLILYPNPISDYLNIDISNINNINQISILSITGQNLFSKKIKENLKVVKINMQNFKSGLYVIEAKGENNIIIKKVIKI